MNKYYSMDKDSVLNSVNTTEYGLTSENAKQKLITNGANKLTGEKKQSKLAKFFAQLKDVMLIILICAAVISIVIAIIEKSTSELVDGIMILLIVVVNMLIGYFQSIKAENALKELTKLSQPYAKVIRDGKVASIKTAELVPGDIVLLEAGDVVPADIYLLESYSLKCDEASLTGESLAVEKTVGVLPEKTSLGDRKNMCYSSSVVVYGRGRGVVVATGNNAEIGKIANMLKGSTNEDTPLQKSLNKLGKIITVTVLIIAILMFVINISLYPDNFLGAFMIAVALAVGAIPEGLPTTTTIIMSLGISRLAKKNVIIKKLHAVETLGCCEIICSDKTGTITQNKMTVREVYYNNTKVKNEDESPCVERTLLLQAMTLCNDAFKQDTTYFGDPTETALISYSEKFIGDKTEYAKKYPRIGELPFDSNRKLMTTAHTMEDKYLSFTKGAVDELLRRCNYISDNGTIRKITDKDKDNIKRVNKSYASKALRVLGYAFKEIKNVKIENKKLVGIKLDEENLIFIGLSGMIDPPRDEVKEAIIKCQTAGMRPIMITGDHKQTAYAIAKELGMVKSIKEVLEGREIDKLSDAKLKKVVKECSVFARVSPEHKVRLVKALKNKVHVVAMTGDGVNDAPSIKEASIGIGMGITGTEVTKSVADMILTDDNFATIVVAVEEGRKIYGNIQKAISFLLAGNIAEVLSIFIATICFTNHVFLLPIQILYVNLITDSIPAIALGVERTEKDLMNMPPRNAKRNIIGGKTGWSIILNGTFQTIIVISAYLIGRIYSADIGSTMAFISLNITQIIHMYNVRTNKSIFTTNPFKNKLLNISFVVGALLTVLICTVPFLESIFKLSDLNIIQWLITIGLSLCIIPLVEIGKLILKKKKN